LKSYLIALSGFVVTVVCCRKSLRPIVSTSPSTFDFSLLSMRPKLPHAPTETSAYIPLLRLLPLTCLYLRGMFLRTFLSQDVSNGVLSSKICFQNLHSVLTDLYVLMDPTIKRA